MDNKKKDIVIELNLSEYLHHHRFRIVQGGVLALFLIVLAGACSVGSNKNDATEGYASSDIVQTEDVGTLSDVKKEYEEVSETDVITDLLTKYYVAYAKNDIETLETICYPISDAEKGYIKVIAKYAESYDDVKVYTKKGYEENSYFVSVVYDVKYKDVKTKAPGMDFYYVCTDDNGNLYINNAYSTFNTTMKEYEDDPNVTALILEFEKTDDVIKLQKQVQDAYDAAIKKDSDLKNLMNTTLPNAVTKWAEKNAEEEKAKAEAEAKAEKEKKEAEEKAKEEAAKTENENAQSDTTEAAKTETTEATKTDDTKTEKTEKEEKFVAPFERGDKIRLTESVNIRKKDSKKADRVGLAFSGEYVKVVKCKKNGWTKVKWKGKKGYVLTSVLEEQ